MNGFFINLLSSMSYYYPYYPYYRYAFSYAAPSLPLRSREPSEDQDLLQISLFPELPPKAHYADQELRLKLQLRVLSEGQELKLKSLLRVPSADPEWLLKSRLTALPLPLSQLSGVQELKPKLLLIVWPLNQPLEDPELRLRSPLTMP